jgi:N-formylglutamate amidohydrolase
MQLFTVTEPTRAETPVIVEVPHAGLHVPPECAATLVAPALSIARDADLFVDELYADAPAEGATLLVSHVSRYFVDLNRAETDIDAESVDGGPAAARASRGIVWRLTSDGAPALARPITRADFEARLARLYRPYHRALERAVAQKTARFGYAVLLAAHSMPSVGRAGHGDTDSPRADVVPGTRGRSSADARVIDLVDRHARDEGWSVRHDDPYRGGFTTLHYGRPADGRHAVQVELSRRLYMDESTLERSAERFDRVRAWCRRLVGALGELPPPAPVAGAAARRA